MKVWSAAQFMVVSLGIIASACSGDSPTDPAPTYASVAGTYVGVASGVTQGVQMSSSFSIRINQSQSDLNGSYSTSGTLTDGSQTVAVQGTGSFSGTIQAGNNPSVNLSLGDGWLPKLSSQLFRSLRQHEPEAHSDRSMGHPGRERLFCGAQLQHDPDTFQVR